MNYKQYPAPKELKNWIRYYWSYDADAADVQRLQIRSFADRFPRLIFQDTRTFSPIKDASGSVKPVCYLSGIDTQPSEAFWDNRFSHFGVSFHPHGLQRLFGMNAAEMTNQTPDIRWINKTELPNHLLVARSHIERRAILNHFFYKRLFATKTDPVIDHLFSADLDDWFGHEGKLAATASFYQISQRQLQRRFKQSVGVSASKFARLTKFKKSLDALSSAQYGDLTQLAYQLDYTDQSHFIKDFKLFSGISPYTFVRQSPLGSESASFIYPENHD